MRSLAFVFLTVSLLVSCSDGSVPTAEPPVGIVSLVGVISEPKALAVDDGVVVAGYRYKAIPSNHGGSGDVVGIQEDWKDFAAEEKMTLSVGSWNFSLQAVDGNGNALYEGRAVHEVVRSFGKVEIVLSRVVQSGTGTLVVSLTDYKVDDAFSLSCLDFSTGASRAIPVSLDDSGQFRTALDAGTWAVTVVKNYNESLNGISKTKRTGMTRVVKIWKDSESIVSGSVGNFRELTWFYLTLPTVASSERIEAYAGYSYAEAREVCMYGGSYLSSWLDGARFEDALYLAGEDDSPSSSMTNLGVVGGESLYAHRVYHGLSWDLSAADVVTSTDMSPAGNYRWNDLLSLPEVMKIGYDHTGWNPVWSGRMPAGDVVYRPVFLAKTLTVTFDYDGADGENAVASKEVVFGEPYGELPSPTREGYTFLGWVVAE